MSGVMKLKEMKIGVPYVVTSNGRTLRKGDHIRLADDKCIINKEAQGWLPYDDWCRLRNTVTVDTETIDRYIEGHRKKIAELEEMKGGE